VWIAKKHFHEWLIGKPFIYLLNSHTIIFYHYNTKKSNDSLEDEEEVSLQWFIKITIEL